jgi:hypothetical protein
VRGKQQATVWLNKGLSSTFDLIESLRAEKAAGEYRIVCSHTHPDFAGSRLVDAFEQEPRRMEDAAYVDYCLDFTRRHRVAVFLPGRKLQAIVEARERFEREGVRLVAAADAATLRVLADKAALYAALGPDVVPLPEYERVSDLAGFDAAYARLRGRHAVVCFKPSVSLFGLGFRVVREDGSALDRLLRGDAYTIGLEEARRVLGERPVFPPLLVMQFLPGVERSVDCLAQRGELVGCVVRRKPETSDGAQLLEHNPGLEAAVRRLTCVLRLDGLFNVQFRQSGEVSCLMEINPRASGGLLYSCLSGLSFPYWAVRLALGTATPADVPRPRTGLRVAKVNRAIAL